MDKSENNCTHPACDCEVVCADVLGPNHEEMDVGETDGAQWPVYNEALGG